MTVTRFAPSPTGLLHVGNVRTALLNWLCARKAGGKFILRIDDTDTARSREAYVDAIKRDLEWLGLDWDRFERQSARMARYEAAADDLRDAGSLYPAYETPEELELRRKVLLSMGKPPVYERGALRLTAEDKAKLAAQGREPHWRFQLEHRRERWDDLIRGSVEIDCASVSDPVLIRADGQFLYTLCSVCDDIDFGVTHIVRGEDHVTNSGTQIQIFRALGADSPAMAHAALLTGAEGEGLSKRFGSLSIADLREAGYEPMAVVSLLARLGSADPVEPCAALEDVIAGFDLSRFGRAPARFAVDDLDTLNPKVLHRLPHEAIAGRIEAPGIDMASVWPLLRDNLERLSDIEDWLAILRGEAQAAIAEEDAAFVAQAMAMLPPRPWDETTWKSWTGAVKAKTGRKGRSLFMPLRLALTGRDKGPDMARLMPFLPPPPVT